MWSSSNEEINLGLFEDGLQLQWKKLTNLNLKSYNVTDSLSSYSHEPKAMGEAIVCVIFTAIPYEKG